MQERFWRLLGACERLAHDETAALNGHDLAGLGKAQQVKAALLADLATEAGLCHASGDSRARQRLTQLLETGRANARVLAGMKASVIEERRKIRAAALQLQTLRSAYSAGEETRLEAFSAHG